MFVPPVRNVARGERVRTRPGLVGEALHGPPGRRVVLTDISCGNGKGPAATVGRFTRTIR